MRNMEVSFCPRCWAYLNPAALVCGECGCDLVEYQKLPYVEKLIVALKHPIPENRMVAIQVLGDLRSTAALPASRSILETEKDCYVLREVVASLRKIGTTESMDLLKGLRKHESRLVKELARDVDEGVASPRTGR